MKERAKLEMVKRYKYLYENAYFILAPIYKQREKYLKTDELNNINSIFEEFLLSDKPMEESLLYQIMEKNRENKEYLNKVKKGLELLEKDNADKEYEILKSKFSIREILKITVDYIEEQSGDLKNKKRKLYILDQYCKIARYRNNGKIYTSGRKLDLHDSWSISVPLQNKKPTRKIEDVGVKNNSFISAILSISCYEYNFSIFTEKEKQQIYLEYHDELPCDLEITCDLEECLLLEEDTRLQRPENTKPCGHNFVISEKEIFINPNNKLYRYYQICPHCGYMVNIPKEILSEGIKQRIEEQCSKDDNLFRKMFLYSELFSLDKSSTECQRKLLNK